MARWGQSGKNVSPTFIKCLFFSNMIRTPWFGEKTNKNNCKFLKTSPPTFISCPTSILESRVIIFSQHARLWKFTFELSLKLYMDAYFYTSLGLAGFSTFFCVNWIFCHLSQKESPKSLHMGLNQGILKPSFIS